MPLNAGDVVARLRGDTSDFTSKFRGAQQQLRQFESHAQRVARSALRPLQGAFTVTARAAQGLLGTLTPLRLALAGLGTGLLVGNFVRINAEFEKFDTQLVNTLGDLRKVAEAQSFIERFTAQTPFELAEVTRAFVALSTAGLNARDLLPKILEGVSAFGGGAFEVERVVRAFRQIADRGKVATQELLQLQEVGIPATKILQEQLGLTNDEMADVAKLSISSQRAIEALATGIQQRFGGATQALSRTFGGIVSNIQALFTIAQKRLGDAGVFGFIKAITDLLREGLERQLLGNQQSIDAWGQSIVQASKNGLLALADLADFLTPLAQGFRDLGSAAFGFARDVVNAMAGARTILDAYRQGVISLNEAIQASLLGDSAAFATEIRRIQGLMRQPGAGAAPLKRELDDRIEALKEHIAQVQHQIRLFEGIADRPALRSIAESLLIPGVGPQSMEDILERYRTQLTGLQNQMANAQRMLTVGFQEAIPATRDIGESLAREFADIALPTASWRDQAERLLQEIDQRITLFSRERADQAGRVQQRIGARQEPTLPEVPKSVSRIDEIATAMRMAGIEYDVIAEKTQELEKVLREKLEKGASASSEEIRRLTQQLRAMRAVTAENDPFLLMARAAEESSGVLSTRFRDIEARLKTVTTGARLFGATSTELAQQQLAVLRAEIQSLLDEGLDPMDARLQSLSGRMRSLAAQVQVDELRRQFETPFEAFRRRQGELHRLMQVQGEDGQPVLDTTTAQRALEQLQSEFAKTTTAGKIVETTFASLGTVLTTGLDAALRGTKSLQESMRDLGQSIIATFSSSLLQNALRTLSNIAFRLIGGAFLGGAGGGGSGGGVGTDAGLGPVLQAQHGSGPITKPTLILAGENPATTPEVVFNRQQLQALPDLFATMHRPAPLIRAEATPELAQSQMSDEVRAMLRTVVETLGTAAPHVPLPLRAFDHETQPAAHRVPQDHIYRLPLHHEARQTDAPSNRATTRLGASRMPEAVTMGMRHIDEQLRTVMSLRALLPGPNESRQDERPRMIAPTLLTAQHGAVVHRPTLTWMGENPATTPEVIFNRQQIQALPAMFAQTHREHDTGPQERLPAPNVTVIIAATEDDAQREADAARRRGEIVQVVAGDFGQGEGSTIRRTMRMTGGV